MSDEADIARQIAALIRKNGVPPARAEMIADLAVHASAAAIEKLKQVIRASPDAPSAIMALEIGVQLLSSRCTAIFDDIREEAESAGLPTVAGVVRHGA